MDAARVTEASTTTEWTDLSPGSVGGRWCTTLWITWWKRIKRDMTLYEITPIFKKKFAGSNTHSSCDAKNSAWLPPAPDPREATRKPREMEDVEKKIVIGVTHWQHPRFHAYFPAGNSYPSILGDMLSDATGCVGFSWAASPACTELETVMLNWMGGMVGLPDTFLSNKKGSIGGRAIQTSASECVLVCWQLCWSRKTKGLRSATT